MATGCEAVRLMQGRSVGLRGLFGRMRFFESMSKNTFRNFDCGTRLLLVLPGGAGRAKCGPVNSPSQPAFSSRSVFPSRNHRGLFRCAFSRGVGSFPAGNGDYHRTTSRGFTQGWVVLAGIWRVGAAAERGAWRLSREIHRTGTRWCNAVRRPCGKRVIHCRARSHSHFLA